MNSLTDSTSNTNASLSTTTAAQSQGDSKSIKAELFELNKKFNLFNSNNKPLKSDMDNENEDDEIEEGQNVSGDQEVIAAKQNLMSISALLNYNKILNGDTSLQTSQTAAAAAAAAALMASSSVNYNGQSHNENGENNSSFGAACNMQPFLFECQEEAFSANFVPCMVYLPVKSKLSAAITVKVTLKPLDQATSVSSNAENNVSNGSEEEDDEEEEEIEENCEA